MESLSDQPSRQRTASLSEIFIQSPFIDNPCPASGLLYGLIIIILWLDYVSVPRSQHASGEAPGMLSILPKAKAAENVGLTYPKGQGQRVHRQTEPSARERGGSEKFGGRAVNLTPPAATTAVRRK